MALLKQPLIHRESSPSANPGPVVLILTANEIKPGTLSPTLLANAQETLPVPAGSVSPSILLSLNTPGLQFPVTGFQPQYVCVRACVCVCVEECLGVMCAVILMLQSSSFANCSY